MLSWVLLIMVVGRGVPLKFTPDTFKKFSPFTVSVKAGPPATALDGLSDEIEGGGP